MRASKSRSRNRPNRSRSNTVGNVVNRVFDSSGPEGKVRGTPQQIIEKYNQLARDAQLSDDRVATENFQQHAEHYLRLLGGAQREIDARREQQERENRDRQIERDRERAQRETEAEGEGEDSAQNVAAPSETLQTEGEGEASTLVETPESKAPAKRAPRKPRQKPAAEDSAESKAAEGGDAAAEPAKPRRRKAKAESETEAEPASDGNAEAAVE